MLPDLERLAASLRDLKRQLLAAGVEPEAADTLLEALTRDELRKQGEEFVPRVLRLAGIVPAVMH